MNDTARRALTLAALMGAAGAALAAGADLGQAQKQATNWTAIGMFGVFVIFTLFITKWAAARTKSAADFYTAGGAHQRRQRQHAAGGVAKFVRADHFSTPWRTASVRSSYCLLARST